MQDSHALANSPQWDHDGWLYGARGSTVTANIRDTKYPQGIWRYHPRTKQFELFGEGGGKETITVLDGRHQRTVVQRKQIEEMTASAVSLMPEKLLDPLSDQQICDLMAYLQGEAPTAPRP